MRWLAPLAVLLALTATARAENCSKSREYLLGGLAGELKLPPQGYDDLFRICMATTAMSNVKDAYILRDGAVGVIAKQDSISATASTLSQFCDAYPRATLRFLTRKELLTTKSLTGIIQMSSTSATPCKKIKGLM